MPEIEETPKFGLQDKYHDIHDKCGEVISKTFDQDMENKVPKAYHYVEDLSIWHDILEGRPEAELIGKAIREYRSSLFSLVQGRYRDAFMALRAHFELTLNAIYLSCYHKKLEDWKEGKYRMTFREAVDEQNGLLSKSFAKTFNMPLKEKIGEFNGRANNVYDECSGFVHGKFTVDVNIKGGIEFKEGAYNLWMKNYDNIRMSEMFSFTLRYIQFLGDEKRARLKDPTTKHLGHIKEIRTQFP
jgi:hypothetical protein